MKPKSKIYIWFPFFVNILASITTLLIYTVTDSTHSIIMYLQVIGCTLITAVIPTINTVFKKEIPLYLNALIATHIILASNLGSSLGFYDKLDIWDLIMHGFYGFLASVILGYIFDKFDSETFPNIIKNIFILLGVLGTAAVWEIFEYCSDLILKTDAQRVAYSLEAGISPMSDTMTDIIIVIPFVILYFVIYKFLLNKKND